MKTLRPFRIHLPLREIRLLLPRREVPVLMYHQIAYLSKDEDPLGLSGPPEVLDKQIWVRKGLS